MSPGPAPAALAWAAALCAVALLTRVPRPGAGVRRRALRLVGSVEFRAGRSPGERLRKLDAWARRALAGRPGVLCLPVGLVLGLATGSPLPVAAGVLGAPLVGRALRRRAERAAADRGIAAVAALCGTVAGDLRAGRPPNAALADAVDSAGWARGPELAGAASLLLSAARFGGDVPQALRAAARLREGILGLAAVAACWQVAVDGGAGLAAALDRVAAALRAEADQREDLRAQLAGPRSTAVLLALLPLFGLVLGAGLGARPSAVLLHTPVGLCCLAAGAALEWAGLAWTARIIRDAEDGSAVGQRGARKAQRETAERVPAGRGTL
ncbi:type II secretion system F family protein [Actinacidiphila sp. ITFR-21]|uniref:type II secretion system F family protein n=1 Tax=Actinacidiphila sp. ITFR-21 TaxID=3075199 RepID=UPI00288C061A|nr:type II secretion system F family protein [Streptomyces sp. ITFR-21]WNI16951.1 type II secretion system F family protein [Streptomyces sp. ITFR-21]